MRAPKEPDVVSEKAPVKEPDAAKPDKAAEKLAKDAEKAAAKAAKDAEKEAAKAAKDAEKAVAKAAKDAEKAAKPPAKKVAAVPPIPVLQRTSATADGAKPADDEEEEELECELFTHEGVEYLIDPMNCVYDTKTQLPIGTYDTSAKMLKLNNK